jgi:hypothetical protein
MSFEIDGFFSPEIERFREAMRITAPFSDWLAYARTRGSTPPHLPPAGAPVPVPAMIIDLLDIDLTDGRHWINLVVEEMRAQRLADPIALLLLNLAVLVVIITTIWRWH